MRLSQKVRGRLGRRAGMAVVSVAPLTAVWILTGLWHGTGWNYIVWGIFWGTAIIVSVVLAPEIKRLAHWARLDVEHPGVRGLQRTWVFMLFVCAGIISQPDGLDATLEIFRRILFDFGPWRLFDGGLFELGLDVANMVLALAAFAFVCFVEHLQVRGSR